MIDIEKYNKLKNDVTTRKEELKNEFTAKNENIVKLQKKRDDLYQKYGLKSPDLNTSDGLYQVASQNGLEDKAKQVIRDNSGEEYKQIFSGGFISDIFDVLNVVSYGTVGILKGKGFADGVKNRESFADSDAMGQYGLMGSIAGIALDIATDPLTYIAPYTIARKIPGLTKAAKFGKEAVFGKQVLKALPETAETVAKGITQLGTEQEGGINLAKSAAAKISFMFGADNMFKETWQRMTRNIGVETVAARNMMKTISKIDKEMTGGLADSIFTTKAFGDNRNILIRKPLAELQRDLSQPVFEKVKFAYDKIDELGKQLVDEGVLASGKYQENVGEYMHQYYQKYIDAKGTTFGGAKPAIKGTKKLSEDLTQEGVEALGRVENPGYVIGRTIMEMTKDLESARLFNKVNDVYATTKKIPGFTKVGDSRKYGSLAGKYVPDYIGKDILPEMVATTEKSMADRVMGEFKFMKVVMSPAAMARNMASNLILNYWKLGLIPGDKAYFKAIKAMKEGDLNKYVKLAKPLGWKADSMAFNELNVLLDGAKGKGMKGFYDGIKDKMATMYQGEESYAKMAAFIKQIDKGISPTEAWKAAESATFNYAEVTPFIRKMRTAWWGAPFITFPLKATPLALETAAKHPARISMIAKMRNAIEEQSDYDETMREKKNEPQWIKDGFFVKLPMKDSEGRSAFFDLTYILPFGDLISGQFIDRNISRETGLKESVVKSVASKNPFFNVLKELSRNQDFTGNKIWQDSDSMEKQLAEVSRHLMKTFLPPPIADQIPGGYNSKNERVETGIYAALTPEEKANQKRTLGQEIMKNFGIKIQPIDADIQDSMNEWQKKKGIGTVLKDENVIKDFSSFYQPK